MQDLIFLPSESELVQLLNDFMASYRDNSESGSPVPHLLLIVVNWLKDQDVGHANKQLPKFASTQQHLNRLSCKYMLGARRAGNNHRRRHSTTQQVQDQDGRLREVAGCRGGAR